MYKKISIKPIEQIRHNSIRDFCFSIKAEIWSDEKLLGCMEGSYNDMLDINKLREKFGYTEIGDLPKTDRQEIKVEFDEMLCNVPTTNVYNYRGLSEDRNFFLLGDVMITADNVMKVTNKSSQCIIDLNGRHISNDELLDHITNVMFKSMKHRHYSIIITICSLLASLTSQLRRCKFQPSFCVFVKSGFNTGKTTAINELINPWNEDTASFEDSTSAITAMMKSSRDKLLIVDDMSSSSRDNMIPKMERIVRLAGDKTTSGQKIVGGKVDNTPIECMVIITGEELPKLQSSSFTRMLILEWDTDEIDWDVINHLQKTTSNTIWFYLNFYRFIISTDDFVESLVNRFVEYRDIYRCKFKEYFISNRFIDMCSWILAMWDKLYGFLVGLGNIGADCSYDAFKTSLEQLVLKSGLQYSQKSATKLFVTALQRLMSDNVWKIVSKAEAKMGSEFDIIEDGNIYFIRSKRVYDKISSYYRSMNADFRCSENEIRSDLDKNGLIIHEGKLLTSEFKTRANKTIRGFYLLANEARKVIHVTEGEE